jgi:hypothetical protein
MDAPAINCWHLLLPLERRARISSSQASVARDAMGSQACWLPERRLRAAATPSARCRARSGHRWRWLVAAVAASAACAGVGDARLVRGPPEVGRSAEQGAKELSRAQRSQRNTADARKSLRGSGERYLLANPFEEECFNPGKDEVPFSQFQLFAQTSEVPRLWDDEDMRDSYEFSLGGSKQRFKSCGQFNNVLQLLLHALAVARALERTLILPGFYFRKGLRRTRIDHFEEEWYPTGHFINTTRLAEAGYKTIEMEEFKRRWWARQDLDADALIAAAAADSSASDGEGGGFWRVAPLTLPRVYIRGLGEQGPRLDNYGEFGLRFEEHSFVEFPFAFQQQSAARWVDSSTPAHNGRYSVWQLGELERWWRNTAETSEMTYQPVLAFDSVRKTHRSLAMPFCIH